MTRLTGKHVLVTAAGQGIGRAVTKACAQEGALVFATDIDEKSLAGLDTERARLDATDRQAVQAFVDAAGPFHAVIHCVGYVHQGSILDCGNTDWQRSFMLNADSFFHVAQAVIPGMIDNGGGSIQCISSVASSIMGVPNRAAYGASKAALVGLVKSIAKDYATQQIRCNAVCPGTVRSPSLEDRMQKIAIDLGSAERAEAMFIERQPMGRIGEPDEVAKLCVYLASDESRFMTGQIIALDGGMSL